MSQMSNYLEDALFNHVFRNTALTSPTTVYVALFETDPGEAGAGTESSGGGYARQAVTFGAPSNGSGSNSGDITFGPATGSDWTQVTHYGFFDAVSAGNYLGGGSLTAAKTVAVGETAKFSTGNLTATMA